MTTDRDGWARPWQGTVAHHWLAGSMKTECGATVAVRPEVDDSLGSQRACIKCSLAMSRRLRRDQASLEEILNV